MMIKNFKKTLLAVASLFLLLAPTFAPSIAFAADTVNIAGNVCGGVNAQTGVAANCGSNNNPGSRVGSLMADVINLFSLLVGIVSVIMIIIGGFQFITANGDSGKITSARTTIIYALVGLVVVLMSQFIVHFVLGRLSGATQ